MGKYKKKIIYFYFYFLIYIFFYRFARRNVKSHEF